MRLDAHNPRVLVNETIREHIKSCGSKIGSVVFYKKDATLRRLRFQLAAMPSRVKGTERGKRASETRSLNHPELLTVWEIGNGFRTVNLDTVLVVQAGGRAKRYRDAIPIGPGRWALAPIVTIQVGREESTS